MGGQFSFGRWEVLRAAPDPARASPGLPRGLPRDHGGGHGTAVRVFSCYAGEARTGGSGGFAPPASTTAWAAAKVILDHRAALARPGCISPGAACAADLSR